MEKFWAANLDESEKKLSISIHDHIGFYGIDKKEFFDLLYKNKNVENIYIDMTTDGGDVFDGFTIYNHLVGHTAKVHAKINLAASIGSYIAMAADTIEIAENGYYMIHLPYFPLLRGNSEELKKYSEILSSLENDIIKAYQKRVNKSAEEIYAMMKNTTWIDSNYAIELNMADKITDEVKVLNKLDSSKHKYENIPVNAKRNYYKNSFIDKITNILNNKKEQSMPNSDLQVKYDNLLNEFNTLKDSVNAKNENTDLIIKDLESKNSNLQNQLAKLANNSLKENFVNYCEGLVKKGCIKPKDVDSHVETLMLRHDKDANSFDGENKKTPLVDSYKNMLESLKVVDTSGTHFADKDCADNNDNNDIEQKVRIECRKLLSEKKVANFSDAYKQVMAEHPEWRKPNF